LLSFPADRRSDRESSNPVGGGRSAGFPIGRFAVVGNDADKEWNAFEMFFMQLGDVSRNFYFNRP